MNRKTLIYGTITSLIICLYTGIDVRGNQVTILDVGQGSGAYIHAQGGFEIVIDTGETNKTLRNLGKVRPWWDRTIDLVIVSHSDKDHAGMVPQLLRRFSVETYVSNGKKSQDALSETIQKDIHKTHVLHEHVSPGEHIKISDDSYIVFLHPVQTEAQELDDNDASVVCLVVIQNKKFLFMGDAGIKIEQELIRRYGNLLDVDVLIVGHHGSKSSTSQELLDAARPTYAVISSGADNRYGHPHKLVLERLEEQGVMTLRTDKLGNVQFRITSSGDFDIVVR